MPLYEYECLQCGDRFEVIQKFSDVPLATHDCGGAVRKLLSAPAFQFKGSGWYVTDYARKGQNGDAKKAETNGENASGDSKGPAKTETKSEAKSEPAKASSGASKD